ncbi:MAG: aminoglycoside phosphotransferase family protein [Muribaculaceae bacterium]|nr:aminoglycoside phosphotransferase family protein [Muribaculaceae bacterium]
MYTESYLLSVAQNFRIGTDIVSIKPLGEGFINDTFIIHTSGHNRKFILQRKNKVVFPDVPAMMDNIERVTAHLRDKVIQRGGDPEREVLTVIRTLQNLPYFQDDNGEYWAVCVFIDGSVTYDRADTPELAFKGGQGIGKFHSMMADFHEPLAEVIKGFHNMQWRFTQWDRALSLNKAGRVASLSEEIQWIESRRQQMLDFQNRITSGEIPTRVSHNDTKISNILFDANGDVLCVIDLDTVMSSTTLNDFGDAIRSYTNTGAEDDRNLSNVSMSLPMFEAYTKGYLSMRKDTLSLPEKQWLAFSARFITFEQVLRFLMDYIDGDTYYKIAYPEHNLVRTRAQYRLLLSIEEQYPLMQRIVEQNI